MAAAAAALAPAVERAFHLPTVKSSPSIAQYAKHKLRDKPYYTPAFSMTKEQWQKTLASSWFRKTDPLMPLYPYGKNHPFPEANYGLYGGTTLQTGSKISKGRNKGKTLRKWFPNIRVETIRSEALDRDLTIPIRARVMRTIRKLGGLDQYVLGDRPARIKELGLLGWKLRWLVMTSPRMRQKYAEERRKLNLPENYSAIETFEEAWNDPERREKMIEEQEEAWTKLKAKMEKWDAHVDAHWSTSDQKHAALKEFYTEEKTRRPHTILHTTPSQIALPHRITETPYEQYQTLPKEVREGERSKGELEYLVQYKNVQRLNKEEVTEDELMEEYRENQADAEAAKEQMRFMKMIEEGRTEEVRQAYATGKESMKLLHQREAKRKGRTVPSDGRVVEQGLRIREAQTERPI